MPYAMDNFDWEVIDKGLELAQLSVDELTAKAKKNIAQTGSDHVWLGFSFRLSVDDPNHPGEQAVVDLDLRWNAARMVLDRIGYNHPLNGRVELEFEPHLLADRPAIWIAEN